jgi:hypothetical protein
MESSRRVGKRLAILGLASILIVGMVAYVAPLSAVLPAASTTNCPNIDSQIGTLASSLNMSKATSLATSSSQFQSNAKGYESSYSSMFNTWSWNTNCSITWTNVNVVFSLSSGGGFVKYVIVSENPALTTILKVSTQSGAMKSGPAGASSASSTSPHHALGSDPSSTTWSGYELAGSSSANVEVFDAHQSYYVPTVSEPYSYACSFTHCDVTVTSALVNTAGGGNGYLAEAGTDSGLYCTIGCSYYYYGWYELYPSSSVQCSNTIHAGDNVVAEVINEGLHGGNDHLYDTYVTDFTNSTSCTVTGQDLTSMGKPYYADTVMTRPTIGGGTTRLPKFTEVDPTGFSNYGGSWVNYYNTYNSGWYNQYTMQNSGNTNISVSVIYYTNYYNQVWSTSSGT